MIVCDHWQASDQNGVKIDLDVVVEDKVVVAVPLQEGAGMLLVEVLKLQHCLGPSPQHSCHKLIHQLQSQVHTCTLCSTRACNVCQTACQ